VAVETTVALMDVPRERDKLACRWVYLVRLILQHCMCEIQLFERVLQLFGGRDLRILEALRVRAVRSRF
jgi:hypothetical protein